jgi:protein tyrosine/serine phosphatase
METGRENARPVQSEPHPRDRRMLVVVVLASISCAMIVWWYAGLRNRFEPVNFGVVEPGRIYRSGQISEHVIRKTIQKNHVGLILSLSGDESSDLEAEKAAAMDLGIDRVYLGGLAGDGLGDPSVYPKALAQIIKANHDGKAVLVHCQSGAQRTGGVIAAYRILVEGQPPEQAFAEMRQYGHDPKHNRMLIPFIEQHLSEWKAQLARLEASAPTRPTTVPS